MFRTLTFPFRLLNSEEIPREDLPENVEYFLKSREQEGLPDSLEFFQGRVLKSAWPKSAHPLYSIQGIVKCYMFYRGEPKTHWHTYPLLMSIEDRSENLIMREETPYLYKDKFIEQTDGGLIDLDFINATLERNIEKYSGGGDGSIPDWWRKERVPVSKVVNAFAITTYHSLYQKVHMPIRGLMRTRGPWYRQMLIKAEFERPITVGDSNQFVYHPVTGNVEEGAYEGKRDYKTVQIRFYTDETRKLGEMCGINLFQD